MDIVALAYVGQWQEIRISKKEADVSQPATRTKAGSLTCVEATRAELGNNLGY